MSAVNVLILFVATLLVCNYVSASISDGRCPPPNKVYNDKPTCFSDADCQKWGKVCCRNQFNTMSCVHRAPWSSGNSIDKYNVKPAPWSSGKRNDKYNGYNDKGRGKYAQA